MTTSASLAAALVICALPLQVLAQSPGGLVIPDRLELPPAPLSHPQAPAKDKDRDPVVIGAAVGALVLSAWCACICGQGVSSGAQHAGAVAMSAGLGALVGAQIGAGFSRGQRVLFRLRF